MSISRSVRIRNALAASGLTILATVLVADYATEPAYSVASARTDAGHTMETTHSSSIAGPTITVTDCSTASQLENALATLLGPSWNTVTTSPATMFGGTIVLACSGAFQLPSTIVIEAGQSLAISLSSTGTYGFGNHVEFTRPPWSPPAACNTVPVSIPTVGSVDACPVGNDWQVFDVNGGKLNLNGGSPGPSGPNLSIGGETYTALQQLDPQAPDDTNAPDASKGPFNYHKGGLIYIAQHSNVGITNTSLDGGEVFGETAGNGGCSDIDSLPGANGGKGGSGEGGAIYNAGTLTVIGSTFEADKAFGGGGGGGGDGYNGPCNGLENEPGYDGGKGGSSGAGKGGAIYNTGTLTVTGSTFENDEAGGAEGGIGGGGGSDNTMPGDGGKGGKGGKGGSGYGGAIYSGPSFNLANYGVGTPPNLSVTSSTFSSNWALGGGGGGGGAGDDPNSLTGGSAAGMGLCGSGGALYPCGTAGQGADGGDGANGGDALGSSIYAGALPPDVGSAILSGNTFSGGELIPGSGGEGGAGGQGGATFNADGSPGPPEPNGQDGSAGGSGATVAMGLWGGPYIQNTDVWDGYPQNLQVTTTSPLPNATVGVPYTTTLSAAGGTAPYKWSEGSGFPSWLSLAPTGTLSSSTTPAASDIALLGTGVPVTVTDNAGEHASATLVVQVANVASLEITTTFIPLAAVGQKYSTTILAIGGTAPYNWSITSGTLPAGLTIDAGTGAISGTVQAGATPGPFSATVKVTDSSTPEQSSIWDFVSNTVNAGGPVPVQILTGSLPSAFEGEAYSEGIGAAGGTAPYTWSIASGSLPAGLSMDPTSGVITGSPGAPPAGSTQPSVFTVTVTDTETPTASATTLLAIWVLPGSAGPTTGADSATSAAPVGSASAGGSGSAVPDTAVTATGGQGTVYVASYAGNPGGPSPFQAGGSYFDVNLSGGSSFGDVVITQCGVQPGSVMEWFDPTATSGSGDNGAWIPVDPPATFDPESGCLTFTATPSSTPSIPEISGSIFGAGSPLPPGKIPPACQVGYTGSPAASPAAGGYTPIPPYRIADTRQGSGDIYDGETLGPCSTLDVQATGFAGVPLSGVSAVVLNVTVVSPAGAGYLTVYPAGTTRPTASSLNFSKGAVVANLVEVAIPSTGQVSIYNGSSGHADVVVDLEGWVSSSAMSLFTPVSPLRICDTRSGDPSGLYGAQAQCGGHTLTSGVPLKVQVAGVGTIPQAATAVVINLTVTGPAGAGYVTAYPAGGMAPVASNVNFARGETIPNRVVVALSSGAIDLVSNTATNAIVDVSGYYSPTGAGYTPVTPSRIADSRCGSGMLAPAFCDTENLPPANATATTLGPSSTLTITVTGIDSVPLTAAAVVLNVTATDTTGGSYLTVWPAGQSRPTASDLNWTAGRTTPNLVVAKVGSGGKVSVYNLSGSMDVVVDLEGWYG